MELDLSKFARYIPQWQPATIPTPADGTVFTLYGARNGIQAAGESYWAARKQVPTSADLLDYLPSKRPAAIIKRLAPIAEECLAKLATYTGPIASAEAEIAALEASLARKPQASDPESVQRAGWIVTRFQGLNDAQRTVEIAAAMDRNDLEVLSCLLAAPRVLNLVPDAYRASIEARMLQAKSPSQYAALGELKAATQVVIEAMSIVRSFVVADSVSA